MDKRTLSSMLKLEENYIVASDYFTEKIRPEMRSKLATWMLEVCEEQGCTDDVYATAMNLFDRLMCVLKNVEVYQLQLLGSVCLFISSKLSSSHKLTALKLVDYTDNSISLEELIEWELFVMDRLRWDVCPIVPNEFIDIFIQMLNLDSVDSLKKHCYAFTAMCATEFKFSKYSSSMIASACILNALEGLDKLINTNRLAFTLNALASIDIDILYMVKEQIADLFKQSSSSTEEEEAVMTTPVNTSIQYEDDYDFDIDYNMNVDNFTNIKQVINNKSNNYVKDYMLSPAPSSPASSSGVSSTSSLLSPSLLSSSYYTNQDMVSMMMVTPPLANSLPMPEFDYFETKKLRRSNRHQRLIQC